MELLDILEKKITHLLELVDELQQKNEILANTLKEKEEEARGLKQEIVSLTSEREHTQQKVSQLISTLDAF